MPILYPKYYSWELFSTHLFTVQISGKKVKSAKLTGKIKKNYENELTKIKEENKKLKTALKKVTNQVKK